uniref:Uncharacterized protein n=1 Tax=Anopheles farauti TaxID=69004 RepID=A0A182QFE1_9DIPT
MVHKSTLAFLLLSFAISAQVHAFWTYCKPHNARFEHVQELLHNAATGQEAAYLEDEKDQTHPTLQRILERLDANRARLKSAMVTMEMYTSNKLSDYSVHRTDGLLVDDLERVFQLLELENDEVLQKLQQQHEDHKVKQQEEDELQQKLQNLNAAKSKLEQTIKQQNETYVKANATLVNLQKIVKQQELERA